MEVGDLGQVRSPPWWGNYQSTHTIVHMLDGVPHQGGLPGQPVRVTRFAGVSFLHVKAAKWGNPPNRTNEITRAVASYFDDFTSKTAKTLMELAVLATI